MRLMRKQLLVMLCLGLLNVLPEYRCAAVEQDSLALRQKLKEQVKQQVSSPFEKKGSADGAKETSDAKKSPEEKKASDVKEVSKTKKERPEDQTVLLQDQQLLSVPAKDLVKTAEALKPEEKNIFLNFENTDLLNFINYIAELKQLNIIPDKALEGVKVSLTIRHPLTINGAWRIFLTVLEMAGFSIAQVGDVHKIIPKDQSSIQPLPSFINVPVETLPDSDLTIRYVVFLENIGVKSVEPLLISMLSDKHKLFAHEDSNGFVITDKSYNIRSAIKLLQELDATGQTEAVVVMKLKNVNAKDVEELLKALIKDDAAQSPLAKLLGKSAEGSGKYFPPGTKIVAEERTNSLILMGLAEVIKKIEDFIVNNVDTQLKGTESPLHIFELQYTDAKQIAEILKEVTRPPEGGPGQQATKYGAVRGGVKYFKSMSFGVDNDGNRLIVSSTDKEDWELLKKTIQDLDKPQPQVAVETLFVSITANDLKELGGAIRNKKHGILGANVDFQSVPPTGNITFEGGKDAPVSLLGSMLNQIIDTQGASILTFGKKNNIWGIFESIKTITNATLLSQPFMTIANKTKATLSFGSERRVEQETGSDQKGFIPVSAKTTVVVEPQINLDGVIRLDIDINIDDFSSTDGGDRQQKLLKTNVTIADGQVLILGGFIQTKVSQAKQKTPLLSEIPLLGWFFKHEKKTVDETYIFIFMAPNIIKPRQLPGMGLYTRMKLHQATDQIEAGITTSKTKDPIFNWYFNPDKTTYSHKVIDYANARYQPTTVDIKNDPYYRSSTQRSSDMTELERERKGLAQGENRRNNKDKMTFNVREEEIKPNQPAVPVKEMKPEQKTATTEQQVVVTKPEQKSPVVHSDVQDRVLKRLQERRQEVMRVDNDLEQRRAKLKDAVSKSAALQAPQQTEISTAAKRDQFKELLSPETTAENNKEVLLPEEIGKRNRLKDFLSKGQEQHSVKGMV